MLSKFLLSLIILSCFSLPGQSQSSLKDPFTDYVNSVPKTIKVLSEENSGSITTKKFTYGSRGDINTVYAVMACPQQKGTYPAVLFLHGGGGTAEGLLSLVQQYAGWGYMAMAIDQIGLTGSKVPNSSGPWKSKPFESEPPRMNVSDGPQNSTLADAEIAGMEAFNLLASQPNVDKKKVGITGFSWGGYSTTMLSGLLGSKVKAAYSVFGCGYYDKGSFWTAMINRMPEEDKTTWLTYLDAGRRAKNIKAPYFIEAPTNDTFFWPEAVKATLDDIKGTKNHVWVANINHKQGHSGKDMQHLYFDYYLKGSGSPFGKVTISKTQPQTDKSKKLTIRVKMPAGISTDSVKLYYSEKGTTWQKRVWLPIVGRKETKDAYSVVLPGEIVVKNADFYIYARDSRGVVVASDMYEAATK